MTQAEYVKEVFTQMTSVGGLLAGLSFAVFVGLCSIEKKLQIDEALIVTFLLSSLALIVATALCGMLEFAMPLAEIRTEGKQAVELASDISASAWRIGFLMLFLGIGLTGFRVSKRLGVTSLTLSLFAAGICVFCFFQINSAFTK